MHDVGESVLCSGLRRAEDASSASRACQCSVVGEAKGTTVRDESVVAEVDIDAVDSLRLFCGLRVINGDDTDDSDRGRRAKEAHSRKQGSF